MTPETFARRLPFFRQGGLQGRNLYLWRGELNALRALLANARVTWADLPSMLPEQPAGDAATRRALERTLHELLAARAARGEILVLSEPGVLARYGVPLTVCYEYVDGSFMVIIVASVVDVSRLGPLPRGLRLQPDAIAEYLRAGVDAEYVVEEGVA